MFSEKITIILIINLQYSIGFLIKLSSNTSQIINDREVSDNVIPINGGFAPDYFDWRDKNMVSPVKNQLSCAACWAFSTIAAIESHMKIHTGREILLSEQFLVDCDPSNAGCGSASILQTYTNIEFGGVLKLHEYPPYADRQLTCRHPNERRRMLVKGHRQVPGNEETMAEMLYKHGPLSVAINSASMANYTNGIDEPTDDRCNPKELNHAVLIVGYNAYVSPDKKTVVPYWIIKNSWGTDWGDKGFYYLVRGRNACGIASDVSFPYVN